MFKAVLFIIANHRRMDKEIGEGGCPQRGDSHKHDIEKKTGIKEVILSVVLFTSSKKWCGGAGGGRITLLEAGSDRCRVKGGFWALFLFCFSIWGLVTELCSVCEYSSSRIFVMCALSG